MSYGLQLITRVTIYFLHTSYELLFIARVTSYFLHSIHLNMEDITDVDYAHGKRVCIEFEIKTLREYHGLYVQSSTSSPAHLFAIKGRQKRGLGTPQTQDQNLPK